VNFFKIRPSLTTSEEGLITQNIYLETTNINLWILVINLILLKWLRKVFFPVILYTSKFSHSYFTRSINFLNRSSIAAISIYTVSDCKSRKDWPLLAGLKFKNIIYIITDIYNRREVVN